MDLSNRELLQIDRRKLFKILSTSALGSLFSACLAPLASASEGHRATNWGYFGSTGPDRWDQLSADFQICRLGMQQSPIDLQQLTAVETIIFNYSESLLKILNNGHTIQVNYTPGSFIILDGQTFELVQFHFHHPSEHRLAGHQFPLELHLVHRNDAGALAVVGVFLQEGLSNTVLQSIWNAIPIEGSEQTVRGITINAKHLLPRDRKFYRYFGSLTTPPCSEGVDWIIMQQPVQISQAQVQQFAKVISMNARPIQNSSRRLLAQ